MPWIASAIGAVTEAVGGAEALSGVLSGAAGLFGAGAAQRAASPGIQQAGLQRFVDPTQYAANLENVQGALGAQKDLVAALQQQQGLKNQSDVFNQLQAIASGQGPNPAQAMLANQTGANIAAQNALMAGQRGAGVNPALIARMAAMQGAGTQQQATGQAAALQAQQSLNALAQMGGLSTEQARQLLQGTAGYSSSALQGQQNLLQAQNAQNQAAIANAQTAAEQTQKNAQREAEMAGNVNQAVGTAIAGPLGQAIVKGIKSIGQTPATTQGGTGYLGSSTGFGDMTPNVGGALQPSTTGTEALSAANQDSSNYDLTTSGQAGPMQGMAAGGPVSRAGQYFHNMAKGGKVKAMLSPGEKYLSPSAVKAVNQGANPMAVGQTVPGRPVVDGAKDSYKNDTVPATLREGGIVLPRSVTKSKEPSEAAKKFIEAIQKKKLKK